MMTVVIGLGATGLSCVRYLRLQGDTVAVVDSRDNPPQLSQLQTEFPEVAFDGGGLSSPLISQADTLMVSPGVCVREPAIAAQKAKGIPVMGDVELFAQAVQKPVIGITGSNGKTTVTSLVGQMIADAGLRVQLCGNIGEPVLDSLQKPSPDYYVVELSSFQLETTDSLQLETAVVLNVCQDHMDRYETYDDYMQAKRRIYHHCRHPVVNADEPGIWQSLPWSIEPMCFSLQPSDVGFCLREYGDQYYLAKGSERLLSVAEMPLKQCYEWQNALAALALGHAIGLSLDTMCRTLKHFHGLPHRCQWVGDFAGVRWYNDSKGTNVGATIAALQSVGAGKTGRLWLLAGGDAKKADLSLLLQPVLQYVDSLILLGKDAPLLQHLFEGKLPIDSVATIEEAVHVAAKSAQPGDIVLLSPACSSLDMFRSYAERGDLFIQAMNDYYEV